MMKAGCAILTMSRMPNDSDTPARHRGIEAADQDAGNDGIDEQIEGKDHYSATQPRKRMRDIPPLGYTQPLPPPARGHFDASVLKPQRAPYREWRAAYWRC